MRPLRLLAAPLYAMLLAGCGTSLVPVAPRPQAALLADCVDPPIIQTPETATDNDVGVMMIKLAQGYVDCRQRHRDLVSWVRGALK